MKTSAPLPVYLSCPIFSKRYSRLRICANAVWKREFNGYCNECWLSGSEKQEEGRARMLRGGAVCLDARLSSESWFGGNMIIFPPTFPRTQGSRLRQEGRALPRHASLEGFLQATSRLFGCHWDCLKRICFCAGLQGAPHQGKLDHPSALDTAVMHLSILRRRGWAALCKLGVLLLPCASDVSWPLTCAATHTLTSDCANCCAERRFICTKTLWAAALTR